MDIEKYITIVTFIPWILIIIVSLINHLNNENYQQFSLSYLRKNIFKIFNNEHNSIRNKQCHQCA